MNPTFTFSNSDDILQMFDDIAGTNNIQTIASNTNDTTQYFSPATTPHYIRFGNKHELNEIAKLIVGLKTSNEPRLTYECIPTILVILTKYNQRNLMEAIISNVTSKPAYTYANAKQIADAFVEHGFQFESDRPVIDLNNDLVDFLKPASDHKINKARRALINISIICHSEKSVSASEISAYIVAMGKSHLKPITVYIDQVNEIGHCSTLCEQQLGEVSMLHHIPILTRANHDR